MEQKIHPKNNASCLSKACLIWLIKFYWDTLQQINSSQKYFKQPKDFKTTKSYKLLESHWKKERVKENPSFFKCILKTYLREYLKVLSYLLLSMSCVLIQSILIGEFITYTLDKHEYLTSLLICVGITFCNLLSTIGNEKMFLSAGELSIKIRANCSQIIFNKVLRTRLIDLDSGKVPLIVQLLNTDCGFFMQLCMTTYVILIPFYIVAACLILYWKIGVSGVITQIMMLLTIPLLLIILHKLRNYTDKISKFSKERIRILSEAIEGIKILKIFGWASFIYKRIIEARQKEIGWYLKKSIFKIVSFTIVTSFQGAFIFFAYWLKVKLTGNLDLAQVFSCVSILLSSHFYITACVSEGLFILNLIKFTSDRILNLLLLREKPDLPQNDKPHLHIKGVFSTWSATALTEKSTEGFLLNESLFYLKDLNIFIGPGQLCGIVGSVGSGKSTFLNTILEECNICEGEISTHSKISYLSQEPWIIQGTVIENILMGAEYDETRYLNVLKICELSQDLQGMIKGDSTTVGAEGKLLSQGQKSRVALARCLYRDSEIYLLDDPFAALDLKVAESIMDKAIKTFLKGKIRLLIVNDIDLLSQCDKIILFNSGYVEFFGNYNSLLYDSNSMNLITNYIKFKGRKQKIKQKFLVEEKIKKKGSIMKMGHNMNETIMGPRNYNYRFMLLWNFCMYGFRKWYFLIAFLALSGGLQVFSIFHQYFIGQWSVEDNAKSVAWYYTKALLVITGIFVIGTLIRNMGLYYFIYMSSKNLHNKAIYSILNANIDVFYSKSPKEFIDTLSGDTFQIDENLTQAITFVLMFGIMIIAYIGYIIYIIPLNLCNIGIFIIYSSLLIRYFIRPIGLLRSIYLQSSGPLINICKEAILGISTIHSLSLTKYLHSRYKSHNLKMVSKFLNFFYCLRCYTTLISIGASLLLSLNFFFIVIFFRNSKSPLIAVSLSFNVGIMNILPWFFRLIIEIVVLLPSVQRIENLHSLPLEESENKTDLEVSKGKIEFNSVTLVYNGFVEMALSDVTFVAKPGKKFGIVGRSGSGKSSILNALFRFTKPYNGSIFIDNQDITKCSLWSLRSQISFVSQNPFIFSGSVKANIDPEDIYDDDKILKTISKVGLNDFISHHGLHTIISVIDLSVGQKQLLALCRVLLMNTKIVLLDEATANVDQVTERMIDEIISQFCKGKTLMTIAHKLKLLLNYDMVMLIDNGFVVDILPPKELLTRDPTLINNNW